MLGFFLYVACLFHTIHTCRVALRPYDLATIRGYPETLQIYRIPASRFWQVRLFVGRKYLRKSTKCENKADAIEFAKSFFDDVKLAQRMDFDVHRDTFAACANKLMERQEALVGRDERDKRLLSEDRKKLNKDILPYFGTKAVADITTEIIDDYVDHLSRDRKLSPSTLNKHLVVIRKVLNEARRRGFLRSLPQIPTVKKKDNPRPLLLRCRIPKTLGGQHQNWQSRTSRFAVSHSLRISGTLIVFHVNVFVRVSDLKVLKHRHVQVEQTGNSKYLAITPISSKTSEP